MLPNMPAMYEAHFGVPMCGAVLNTLNTRLDAEAIAFMLEHGEAKVLITDREFSGGDRAGRARAAARSTSTIPSITGRRAARRNRLRSLPRGGDPQFAWQPPADEWDAISLNYTSGTTGNPKGVVYHHRGAYLNAICNIVTWSMPQHAVYLWTLPMFHCNGWTFPWTMAANAGTNVCLRKVDADGDLRPRSETPRHALLRRADRAQHADQRARRAEAGHRAQGARHGRRRRRRRRR